MAIETYFITFNGLYPTGGAYAVIRARDRGHARRMLMERLKEDHLLKDNEGIMQADFKLIDSHMGIHVFANGDY